MIWWTSIVVVGVLLLTRESSCQIGSRRLIWLEDDSLSAEEGSCVQIGCTASGLRQADYPARWTWFKNAEYNPKLKKYSGTVVYSSDPKEHAHRDFEGSGRVQYIGSRRFGRYTASCSVRICCLRMNDSGRYDFRYERDHDEYYYTTPSPLKLQVKKNPCQVQFETTQRDLKESEVAEFNCSTPSSCPRAPLIEGFPARTQYQHGTTSTVAKLVVDWKDNQRELSCYIPPLGDNCLQHHHITLNVEYSPRKPALNASRNRVELGGSLTLTCSAEAVPALQKYTWFLPLGRMKMTTDNTWHLQSVTKAHHGAYQCSATNALGQGLKSSQQYVEVLFAPDRPVLSLDPVATEGKAITIGCTVESWPLPSSLILSWSSASDPSMHGTLHQVSNTASLTMSLKVTSASTGRYTCIARNSQGFNQSGQELEVHSGHVKEIFWAIPFLCIPGLAVITYLVCSYKRNKLVSDGAPDPLPVP